MAGNFPAQRSGYILVGLDVLPGFHVVGDFHDVIEIVSSLGMNMIVAVGFVIDYRNQNKKI